MTPREKELICLALEQYARMRSGTAGADEMAQLRFKILKGDLL